MKPKNFMKKDLGKRFEELIENANIQYMLSGSALIEKTEVQTKMINGKMIYTKKGMPDFVGTIEGGKSIAFDAKSTKGKSFPIKNILSRVHQLQYLTRTERLGGHAFYLIEFKDLSRFFLASIQEIEKAVERSYNGGRKSIPIEEFEMEVFPGGMYCLDYLAPILGRTDARRAAL